MKSCVCVCVCVRERERERERDRERERLNGGQRHERKDKQTLQRDEENEPEL